MGECSNKLDAVQITEIILLSVAPTGILTSWIWSYWLHSRAVRARTKFLEEQAAAGHALTDWTNPQEVLGLDPEQRMHLAVASFLLWAV
jgi:hypothetical protein